MTNTAVRPYMSNQTLALQSSSSLCCSHYSSGELLPHVEHMSCTFHAHHSITIITVMVIFINKKMILMEGINITLATLQEQGMGGTVYDRDTIMKKYMNGYDGEHRHQALYATLDTAAYCSHS